MPFLQVAHCPRRTAITAPPNIGCARYRAINPDIRRRKPCVYAYGEHISQCVAAGWRHPGGGWWPWVSADEQRDGADGYTAEDGGVEEERPAESAPSSGRLDDRI